MSVRVIALLAFQSWQYTSFEPRGYPRLTLILGERVTEPLKKDGMACGLVLAMWTMALALRVCHLLIEE